MLFGLMMINAAVPDKIRRRGHSCFQFPRTIGPALLNRLTVGELRKQRHGPVGAPRLAPFKMAFGEDHSRIDGLHSGLTMTPVALLARPDLLTARFDGLPSETVGEGNWSLLISSLDGETRFSGGMRISLSHAWHAALLPFVDGPSPQGAVGSAWTNVSRPQGSHPRRSK